MYITYKWIVYFFIHFLGIYLQILNLTKRIIFLCKTLLLFQGTFQMPEEGKPFPLQRRQKTLNIFQVFTAFRWLTKFVCYNTASWII